MNGSRKWASGNGKTCSRTRTPYQRAGDMRPPARIPQGRWIFTTVREEEKDQDKE
jgi:hypothetical protein